MFRVSPASTFIELRIDYAEAATRLHSREQTVLVDQSIDYQRWRILLSLVTLILDHHPRPLSYITSVVNIFLDDFIPGWHNQLL